MTLKEFLYFRVAAFGHAFRGWAYVLKTQHNAWIHSVVATLVIAVGLWLKLNNHDWAILIITIAMVFMAEFINTAIEAVVDLASPVHHPLAKVGKDVGAAAVLVAALSGVVIGLLVMGPPLWQRLGVILGQSPALSRAEQTAFKGMELYSWQNKSGEWQYAVLEGANRNKTWDEIQSTPLDLQGVENAIARMAIGESLFWMNNVYDTSSGQVLNLPLPPDTVVNELKEFAREKQVGLYIP